MFVAFLEKKNVFILWPFSIILAYGEAFITTFRTFLTPLELIQKLIHRYTIFICQANDQKQKAAKESFSLLVRVVCDLT